MDKIGILVALEGASKFKSNLSAVNTSLKSLTQQLNTTTSKFSSFSSTSEKAEASQKLLRTYVAELTSKLSLQKQHYADIVKAQGEASKSAIYWQGEIAKTTQALNNAEVALQGYDAKLAQGNQKVSTAKAELEALNTTYTKQTSVTTKASQNQKLLNDAIEAQKKVVSTLKAQVADYTERWGANATATLEAREALAKAEIELHNLNEEFRDNSALALYSQKMQEVGNKVQSVGQSISAVGRSLTTYVTTPILALGAYAVKSASDFETAFTGVTKTVDGTSAQFAALKQGIMEMSTETASTKEEIAETMEVVGRLGVEVGENGETLLQFTKTMIELGDSTDISAEQAADSLAKFMNVTRLSNDSIENLGSAIVDLGNHFAANESEIVELMQRLASAGTTAGLTAQEIAGLSTAIIATGVEAEAGGTAMAQTFKDLDSAVSKWSQGSGDALNTIAGLSGMTASEFADAWQNKPMDALEAFFKGLNGVSGNSIELNNTLNELGMTGLRQSNLVKNLALSFEDVEEAVDTANSAFEDNTALARESAKRYQTFESRVSQLKEEVKNTASEFGEALLPVLEDAMDSVKDVAKSFSQLTDDQKKTIIKTAAVVAALGPVVSVVGKLTSTIGGAAKKIGEFGEAWNKVDMGEGLIGKIKQISTGFGEAVASSAAFSTALGAVGVVAAAAIGMYDQYKNSLAGMRSEMQKNLSALDEQANAYYSESDAISAYADTVTTLQKKENLSVGEKAKMKLAVEALNKAYPDLGLSIDETTGKIADFNDETLASINSIKQQAKAAATYKVVQKYMEELVDTEMEHASVQADLEDAQASLKTAQDAVNESMNKGAFAISTANNAYQDASAKVDELSQKNAVFSEKEAELNTRIDEVSAMLETEGSTASTTATQVDGLTDSTGELSSTTTDTTSTMLEAWENYKSTVTDAANTAAEGFNKIEISTEQTFDSANTALDSQIEAFNGYATNVDTIKGYIAGLSGEAQTNAENLLNYVMSMGIDGAGYMKVLADSVSSGNGQFDALSGKLATAQGALGNYASAVFDTNYSVSQAADAAGVTVEEMAGAIGASYQTVANSAQKATDTMASTSSANFSKVYSNANQQTTNTANVAGNNLNRLSEKGKNATNGMNTAVSAGLTQLKQLVFSGTAQAASQADKYSTYHNYGAMYGQGLVDGMSSKLGAVRSKAAELANAAAAATKAAAAIGSPSRVAHELGQWWTIGLANGIASKQDDVVVASTDVTNAMIGASGMIARTNGARTMSIASNGLDINGISEAVQAGASNANIKIYLNDREVTRSLKGLGVSFA